MSQTRQRVRPLAVGVDLGGTWIRVVILRDGRATRRVKRVSRMPELDKVLPNVLESRRRVRSLVVAARGVWTAAERAALRRRLRGLAERVEVISDVEAALLGALGSRPGVLVLAGTGSIVLGRDGHGRLARAGGLGPLIGDEGSAFWLGREWLRLSPESARAARALARRPDAIARIARGPGEGSRRPPSGAWHRGGRSGAPRRPGCGCHPAPWLGRPRRCVLERQSARRRLVPRRFASRPRAPGALPVATPRGRSGPGRGPARRPAGVRCPGASSSRCAPASRASWYCRSSAASAHAASMPARSSSG